MNSRVRVAMLGSKGLPATFGGVEHHVESIGRRLVDRGFEVTVFSRLGYGDSTLTNYRGMHVKQVRALSSKHLEAISASAVSTLSAMRNRFDILHYHAVGPGSVSPLPRYFSSAKIVQTIHGLDAERSKWGGLASAYLQSATWLSARVPDATVVVSQELQEHFRKRYGRETVHIPNGIVHHVQRPANIIADRYGLSRGRYVLFVGRLVPEKNPDLLIDAYKTVSTDLPLVIAGGTSHSDDFLDQLRDSAKQDERVRMIGYVFGDELDELYSNAGIFVLPSALEGLPLALLEALSMGVPIVASDIAPHREVLERDQPGGRLVPVNDVRGLGQKLSAVIDDLEYEAKGAESLRARVLKEYDWDLATDLLQNLYWRLLAKAN